MSKPTLKEMIAVMQAAEDGATIKFKLRSGSRWIPGKADDMIWDWDSYEYCVKRETRKVYFVCDAGGSIDFGRVFTSQEMADWWCRYPESKSVEFVEVLRDDESTDV